MINEIQKKCDKAQNALSNTDTVIKEKKQSKEK